MRGLITSLLFAFVLGCTSPPSPPSSRACARSEAPVEANLEEIATAAGQRIAATPRVLVCNHAGLAGSVDCEATGPGFIAVRSASRQTVFVLERGERATLNIDAAGAVCRIVP